MITSFIYIYASKWKYIVLGLGIFILATIVIIAVILNPGSDNPSTDNPSTDHPFIDNSIALVDGTVITLKADNGLYLSRINYNDGSIYGENFIEASKPTKDIFCKFFVTTRGTSNGSIALSGKYYIRASV